MSPMKNLVLEMETTYLKPLFKRISIFEKKKLNLKFKFWIFFMLFLHTFLCGKYVECAAFAFLYWKLSEVDLLIRVS